MYPKIQIWKDFLRINRWLRVWGMLQGSVEIFLDSYSSDFQPSGGMSMLVNPEAQLLQEVMLKDQRWHAVLLVLLVTTEGFLKGWRLENEIKWDKIPLCGFGVFWWSGIRSKKKVVWQWNFATKRAGHSHWKCWCFAGPAPKAHRFYNMETCNASKQCTCMPAFTCLHASVNTCGYLR